MPSPFPGMDPYLESPQIWPDVHCRLIPAIGATLNPGLRPHYFSRVELRVYVSEENDPGRESIVPDVRIETSRRKDGKKSKSGSTLAIAEPLVLRQSPGLEIEEAYLKIVHAGTGSLVTIIEVLSPTNKIRGAAGHGSFMEKREEVLNSEVHWVEIDLLRNGILQWFFPTKSPSTIECSLLVRMDRESILLAHPAARKLPVIGIPLRGSDPDAPLDLGAIFKSIYDLASYDLSVDYRKPLAPPLTDADAKWREFVVFWKICPADEPRQTHILPITMRRWMARSQLGRFAEVGVDWYLEMMMACRIMIATLFGAFIGWERRRHGQEAGVRTYAAVAVGACAFALVSSHVEGSNDPTRIAAQVVSGIGFLGGGVILRDQGRVRGLTTAATLWATAAVGLATGFGMYVIAGLCSFIIFGLLSAHHLPGWGQQPVPADDPADRPAV